MKSKQKTKTFKKIFIILLALFCAGVIALLGINGYVKHSTADRILLPEDINDADIDCILVLGAGVWYGDTPSPMLEARLDYGISLYEDGISNRLLMSGDHSTEGYDEVNVMKNYALKKGIPSEHIFMDHCGLSTYDSLYRALEIFEADKIVIVTQEYHLYRALYIAEQLGIEAYGVGADPMTYSGQTARDIREVLARVKDFFKVIIKPDPAYLGDVIPVSGNGDVTNDY